MVITMEKSTENPLKLLQNQNYAYSLGDSFNLAAGRLVAIADYDKLSLQSGARYRLVDTGYLIFLSFFDKTYRISVPDVNVSITDCSEAVPLREQVLILHYLLNARGTPLGSNLITFWDLPEGPVYFRTFRQRTLKPLIDSFGENPRGLLLAGKVLGGRQSVYGDTAVTIDAFSRVPVTLVLWSGDAELPPEGNILYDSSIVDYLPTEDIIVLTEMLVWKLIRLNRSKD